MFLMIVTLHFLWGKCKDAQLLMVIAHSNVNASYRIRLIHLLLKSFVQLLRDLFTNKMNLSGAFDALVES